MALAKTQDSRGSPPYGELCFPWQKAVLRVLPFPKRGALLVTPGIFLRGTWELAISHTSA